MDPKRNSIRGEIELSKYLQPPFEFRGVTSYVFPLRADISKLGQFCDSYLNSLLGGEVAEFHPALPFVFLAVLHYEKMFAKDPGQSLREVAFSRSQPRSWVSQNELLFAVPVEWYRKESGRAVFNDWAYVTPFIFVDSDYSLTLGREVYGWPKLAASFTSEGGLWLSHPEDPSHQMVVLTADLPWTNVHILPASNERDILRKLLGIDIKIPSTFSQLRPDVNPLSLLLSWPQTVLGGLATMYDWIGVFGGLANPWSQPPVGQQPAASMMAKGLRNLGTVWSDLLRKQIASAFLPDSSPSREIRDFLERFSAIVSRSLPDSSLSREIQDLLRNFLAEEERGHIKQFSFPQITLKQFPESRDPQKACYQALIKSPLHVIRYGNGGLLGDVNLLQGDTTGGFQLHLHYDKTDEKNVGKLILERLGLEVAKTTTKNREDIAILNPVYPFWFEGDLRYEKGEKIWWRVKGRTHTAMRPLTSRMTDLPLVLTAGGPFQQEQVINRNLKSMWPFPGQEVALHVYPLRADEKKLVDFCKNYLNDPYLPDQFQPYTAFEDFYVYLIVVSYGSTPEDTRMKPREVEFFLPVQWLKKGGVVSQLLVSPYVFIDSDNNTIIDREWNGRPTMDAKLYPTVPPDAPWPQANSRLQLKTELIADTPGPIKPELLLQIDHGAAAPAVAKQKRKNSSAPEPKDVVDEILFPKASDGNRSISNVMVKEFRDAADPQLACYQEIMFFTQKIELLSNEAKELGINTHITIYKYKQDTYPIIEKLGLPGPVCTPVKPFSLQIKAQEESRTDVYWRTDPDREWQSQPFWIVGPF